MLCKFLHRLLLAALVEGSARGRQLVGLASMGTDRNVD